MDQMRRAANECGWGGSPKPVLNRVATWAVIAWVCLPLFGQGNTLGQEKLLSQNPRETHVEISSLRQLAEYGVQSGNIVTMEPGVYQLIDYLPLESMDERRENEDFSFITFSGSDNVFKLDGVTIEVDTRLRSSLRPPIHSSEFVVSGDHNEIQGLTITNIGEGTSPGGALLSIAGDGNTLRDCTFHVRGSFPYGYGDLFGKGGRSVISHRKHSGMLVTGSDSRIIGCKLFMRSFGHGYFVQGGENQLFEDCYIEGEMRSTDDMLDETSGPAFDAEFRTIYRNRQGNSRVLPGYMKSLAEDGFRMYGQIEKLTFKNCVSKNMRAGFELRTDGGVHLENCTAIGNERGFWVAGNAEVRNSKGDAQYGPLLFLEGDNASVELELIPTESAMTVHALATVHGAGHQVTIAAAQDKDLQRPLPILVGYSQPGGGEAMSPYGQRTTTDLILRNETLMPVIIGTEASDCQITTLGPVQQNLGEAVSVRTLEVQAD